MITKEECGNAVDYGAAAFDKVGIVITQCSSI